MLVEQSDMFSVNQVPRVCDCWIGDGVVLCDNPGLCRALAAKHDAEG
jgi:hypothetical protein